VGAAFHLRSRHLYGFLPIAILFAAEGLGRLAEGRVGGARRAGAFIVIAAALLGAGPVLDSTGADAERWDRHHRFHRKLGAFLAHHSDPGDVVLLANPGSLFNPLGNALAWHSRRTLLEYSPFTLDSSLLRGRALLVLSCSLAASRPSSGADEAPPPESLGLAPQAGFRHDLGQCTFYRRPEGDRN
jgi:hypothetical protein